MKRVILAVALVLACGGSRADPLPMLGSPQDPSQFIARENALRGEINANFTLQDGSNAANPVTLPGRLIVNGSLSGDQGETLKGGLEVITDTSLASTLTNIGKINSIYAVNKFGTPGGPNAKEGQRAGIFAKVEQNGPTDYTSLNYQFNSGIWSWVLVNQGNTTVGQEPNYTGLASLVELGGTSRAFHLIGAEYDVNIGPTVDAVGHRIGVLAAIGAGTFGAPGRAIGFDGAYAIARSNDTAAAWKQGYMLRGPMGVWPFASDSVLFGGLGSAAQNGYAASGTPVSAVAGIGIDLRGIDFTYNEYISDHFALGKLGGITITGSYPLISMRNSDVAIDAGGLTRWMGGPSGGWKFFVNTAAAGDFSAANIAYTITPLGGVQIGNSPAGVAPLEAGEFAILKTGSASIVARRALAL